MIDPATIEDIDDFDGENVLCMGIDSETKKSAWAWVPLEVLMDASRMDIVRRFRADDDEW